MKNLYLSVTAKKQSNSPSNIHPKTSRELLNSPTVKSNDSFYPTSLNGNEISKKESPYKVEDWKQGGVHSKRIRSSQTRIQKVWNRSKALEEDDLSVTLIELLEDVHKKKYIKTSSLIEKAIDRWRDLTWKMWQRVECDLNSVEQYNDNLFRKKSAIVVVIIKHVFPFFLSFFLSFFKIKYI